MWVFLSKSKLVNLGDSRPSEWKPLSLKNKERNVESRENRKKNQTMPAVYHMEVLYLEKGLESNQTLPLKSTLIFVKI